MARIIMHIDLNAFFVRCEEIKDPSLVGKPVLIGHEGRAGIVATASYKAREFGCRSGDPMFQALQKCPNAIVKEPDHRFYSVMSNVFATYLRNYSQQIEQASIDECYVDMSEAMQGVNDPQSFLEKLQQGLYRESQLMCSIGIAPTKWLAKMGSDFRKPMGITFIRKKDIPTILYPLKIEDFWGIGRKTSPRLRQLGINTIGDFAIRLRNEDPELKGELGKFFYDCKSWIEGTSSDAVIVEQGDPKSIGNSKTLMHDENSLENLEGVIKELSIEVASRAKNQGLIGYTITLSLKDNDFRLHSAASTSSEGTNDPQEIYRRSMAICKAKFSSLLYAKMVRLVGISLSRLEDPRKATVQMSLWNYGEYEEMDRTKLLIADLNNKMEKPLLRRASEAKKGK